MRTEKESEQIGIRLDDYILNEIVDPVWRKSFLQEGGSIPFDPNAESSEDWPDAC